MNKIYDDLKLFKTKKFKSKREENDYFIKIQEENIFEYKKSLLDKFEDYYHIMWSRKFVSIISAFVLLGMALIYFYVNIYACIILFLLSLFSMILSQIFQNLLNKKVNEENFVIHFLDKHINEEYEIIIHN
jgi:hypothetical protein